MSSIELLASKITDCADLARAPKRDRRPLTMCRGFGLPTLLAVVRRSALSRRRLLLRVDRLPSPLGIVERVILHGVDILIVDSDRMARAVRDCGVAASRIVLLSDPNDSTLFKAVPRSRAGPEVRRLLHVGDLEPEAGVADLLACISAWAELHPEGAVEVWWAGEGCMRGVLQAQPLPTNIAQRFLGEISRQKLASLFLECDMLVVPALSNHWSHVVGEAITCGLPVLGSNHVFAVQHLVTDNVTGWTFDPFEPGSMTRAVEIALEASSQDLERMRTPSVARCRPGQSPEMSEGSWAAVRLGVPVTWSGLGRIEMLE